MDPLAPARDTIACWRVDLDQPDDHLTALTAVLGDDEQERAKRFALARDRRRFVVARACLRVLLAAAEGRDAASICFAYGERGKPSLAGDGRMSPLHFSVSHSQDVAVIALSRHAPLGVDVEALRPLANAAHLARRYFTAAEADTIATAPADERLLTFFLCWTRKEALAKARDDGLALALPRYRVSCRPGEPARVLEIDGRATDAAQWSLYDLPVAPACVGAVATHAPARPLTLTPLEIHDEVLPRLRR
jgi:4'-phosphopantetheinyl transferase